MTYEEKEAEDRDEEEEKAEDRDEEEEKAELDGDKGYWRY
jgi:hypothetical protein